MLRLWQRPLLDNEVEDFIVSYHPEFRACALFYRFEAILQIDDFYLQKPISGLQVGIDCLLVSKF